MSILLEILDENHMILIIVTVRLLKRQLLKMIFCHLEEF